MFHLHYESNLVSLREAEYLVCVCTSFITGMSPSIIFISLSSTEVLQFPSTVLLFEDFVNAADVK